MKTNTALCLDLGGTSLKAAVIKDGNILRQTQIKTDTSHGLDGIKNTYLATLPFLNGEQIDFVSTSSAGRIDAQTAICNYATDTLPGYTGFDIGDFLRGIFHVPCFALNDGHAAALGEFYFGSACQTMLMLTLGTGLGGAIIQNGIILNFPSDRDMGHLILVENGLLCNCGRRGCLERYAGGTALNLALAPYETTQGSRQNRWQRFKNGEPPVVQAVQTWIANLGSALSKIHSQMPFDEAVLGGGVTDDATFWFSPTTFAYLPFAVRISNLGNNAGILGAYQFGLNKFNGTITKAQIHNKK